MDDISNKIRKITLAGTIKRYQSLLESVDGIVWEADANTFQINFVSDSITHILGYKPSEWLGNPELWHDRIYPDDREIVASLFTTTRRNHSFDYRMIKADGNIIWMRSIASLVYEKGEPRWLRGITVDITETKLLADLEKLEKEVLELNSKKDTDIESVLRVYVLGLERLFPQMTCSVLRVTDNRVYGWATPSLPTAFTSLIDGLEIGLDTGSCGTAAYTLQRVVVSDIEHDPKWARYKHLALPHNLRACWSTPIIDSLGAAIAVFGIYYNTIRIPTDDELAIVERSAAILKVIIENRLYAHMMQEANLLVTQGQELANFGTWQWNMDKNKVSWSPVLYHIYGLNERDCKPSFEKYLDILHPDDKARVQQIIQDTIDNKTDAVFDERIIQPDGTVKYLRSWARVMAQGTGRPMKIIGACLDVTQTKTTQAKMEEIAWTQSHVVRAPLARLMGLVYLLREYPEQEADRQDLLSAVMSSADELDGIIRSITYNTEI